MRAHYEELETAQMTVKILSDFSDSALEYQVNYEYNKEDNDLLTVTAPASIEGIQVEISGDYADEFTIQYQDAQMVIDGQNVAGLTPVDAVADLMHDLRTGEPSEVGKDTVDGIQMVSLHYETVDKQPHIAKTVWLNPQTLAPVCAELYCDGQKQLTLVFMQFE